MGCGELYDQHATNFMLLSVVLSSLLIGVTLTFSRTTG